MLEVGAQDENLYAILALGSGGGLGPGTAPEGNLLFLLSKTVPADSGQREGTPPNAVGAA